MRLPQYSGVIAQRRQGEFYVLRDLRPAQFLVPQRLDFLPQKVALRDEGHVEFLGQRAPGLEALALDLVTAIDRENIAVDRDLVDLKSAPDLLATYALDEKLLDSFAPVMGTLHSVERWRSARAVFGGQFKTILDVFLGAEATEVQVDAVHRHAQ